MEPPCSACANHAVLFTQAVGQLETFFLHETFHRNARGLSQEQLAELGEFHRTYVAQLERCVTNISIDGLERLAQALEVDVIDLLKKSS